MRSFEYCVPTKVIFGEGTEAQCANEIKEFGGTNVMVVYGGGSAKRSGLLDRVSKILEDGGLKYTLFGGVQPNPHLGLAREGIAKAIELKCDFLLAIGGGSVIDTAKAIAHGAANPELDIWTDIWSGKAPLKKTLPVGVILTIPAAGSETSDSAVLTNEETKEKRGLNCQANRPRFAIMNPALAATLPKYHLACGVTDIMMHTLDRYFNSYMDNDLTDEFAEALLRTVIKWGQTVVEHPDNYRAMSEIMWCGSVSHNGLTGLGGKKDFSVHQLGHELSGVYDTIHGATLAAMWGHYAEYVVGEHPERFERYARNVWGLDTAEAGIEATVNYFKSLGMPVNLPELVGHVLNDEEIEVLTTGCSRNHGRTIGSFKVLSHDDMRNIYISANHR